MRDKLRIGIGPLLWISSIQYFIAQLVVVAAWPRPYDWANHYISDLGNTVCGPYAGLYVCSPLYILMNTSFVLLGITMTAGALLMLRAQLPRNTFMRLGLGCIVLSGLGTVAVGVFPENVGAIFHTIGAFLGLGVGALGIVLFGFGYTHASRFFKLYTIVLGFIALAAFILFVCGVYAGLGRGGMERLSSYPFTVWLITAGMYVLHARKKVVP